jgi:hypothetical protein
MIKVETVSETCKNVQNLRKYKNHSYVFLRIDLAFLYRRFLSTTIVRVHFDGDLVAESGRELLNVTLGYFADFRVRCIIAGRRILGNILHG